MSTSCWWQHSCRDPLETISSPITWLVSVVFCDKLSKPHFLYPSSPCHFPKPIRWRDFIFGTSHLLIPAGRPRRTAVIDRAKCQPKPPPAQGYVRTLTEISCRPDDWRKRSPQPPQAQGCLLPSAHNRHSTGRIEKVPRTILAQNKPETWLWNHALALRSPGASWQPGVCCLWTQTLLCGPAGAAVTRGP